MGHGGHGGVEGVTGKTRGRWRRDKGLLTISLLGELSIYISPALWRTYRRVLSLEDLRKIKLGIKAKLDRTELFSISLCRGKKKSVSYCVIDHDLSGN